jgi:hypothetical protein
MNLTKTLHHTRASNRKYHFIYKTTCLITNRWYIGMHSTNCLDDGYIGSGKRLWLSIKKYGIENHVREILEFCEDRKTLAIREKEIVTFDLLQESLCMNLALGGHGGWEAHNKTNKDARVRGGQNAPRTEHMRKRASETIRLTVKRLRDAGEFPPPPDWTGKKHTEETKTKMSQSHLGLHEGEKHPNYGKRNRCVSKDGVTKRIPLSEVEKFLADGWVLGIKKDSNIE